jgi:protein SCO1/2
MRQSHILQCIAIAAILSLGATAHAGEGQHGGSHQHANTQAIEPVAAPANALADSHPNMLDGEHAMDHRLVDDGMSFGGDHSRVRLPALELQDQHGKAFALYGDRTRDRTLVLDFVYTSCTTICPVLTGVMRQLHEKLKACPDVEVAFVLVSVDPAIDTPERLKQYAEDASAPWYWLTGSQPIIDRLLRSAGLAPGAPEDHPPLLLMGNLEAPDDWYRWLGIPATEQLLQGLMQQQPTQAACLQGLAS